jgi:hypothetical protein
MSLIDFADSAIMMLPVLLGLIAVSSFALRFRHAH